MFRSTLVALAVCVAGCDPFVVEIDDSSICTVVAAQPFQAGAGGLSAVVPLGLSPDLLPASEGVSGSVQVVSVSVVPGDGSVLDYVTQARVRLLPSSEVGSTVGQVVAAAATAPKLEQGALNIPGNDADIFTEVANGPAQLSVELGAPSGHALTANIGICVRVNASAHYLE
jgi:hypothetical protein